MHCGNRELGVAWLAAVCFLACSAAIDALGAPPRNTYPPRGAPGRQQPPAQPQQPAADVEIPAVKEAVIGDDLDQNIKALQQEKLDLIRQRVALLNRASASGQITQQQLDQAMLEQLHQELEVIDRPQLRVIALEQIVAIVTRFEEEAKKSMTPTGKKASDVGHAASLHGRYVSARLRRIDAQIRLEKEKLAIKNQTQPAADKPK